MTGVLLIGFILWKAGAIAIWLLNRRDQRLP